MKNILKRHISTLTLAFTTAVLALSSPLAAKAQETKGSVAIFMETETKENKEDLKDNHPTLWEYLSNFTPKHEEFLEALIKGHNLSTKVKSAEDARALQTAFNTIGRFITRGENKGKFTDAEKKLLKTSLSPAEMRTKFNREISPKATEAWRKYIS